MNHAKEYKAREEHHGIEVQEENSRQSNVFLIWIM